MLIKLFLILLLLPVLAQAVPLNIEQTAPGVYVHHGQHLNIDTGYGGDICNVGFIVGNTAVAVIDSGGSPRVGRELREAIRQVTDLPIRYVINTHFHPDHVLGNAAFKDDHPVFVGHHNVAAGMMQHRDAYLKNQPSWVGKDAEGSEMIPPSLSISGVETLDLGGRVLQLSAQPIAHTNSDLTVFDLETATLWTGDLLFIERTPSSDGDIRGWLQVITQLRQIPARRVVPGHGPVSLDWQGALDNEQRYLALLLDYIRNAIKQDRSMEQTIAGFPASENGKWVLFDTVNKRNIALIFPMLEWE
ncbi:MAG: quinoprotein relay system zinc metallohydrolase 2 [Proteobacteria bacterium]|nr:quinoprotein relay system zinc metallohydrolase 2 [Pseudomonadota bacterium]